MSNLKSGSLAPGSRIGSYEVVASIGAGGMGEVFRARDTKLGRDVAIKVLPAAFADDPERLARFTHEAQVRGFGNHFKAAAAGEVAKARLWRCFRPREQTVLVADHGRPFHLADGRDLGERDLRARVCRHEDSTEAIEIVAQFARVADVHRETGAPLDGGGDVLPADRGEDHLLHRRDAEAPARQFLSIQLEVDEVPFGGPLGEDAASAPEPPCVIPRR